MKKKLNILFLLTIFTSAISSVAYAIDYVKCESDDRRYRRCELPYSVNFRDVSVWIDKNYSKTDCVRGSSWGLDKRGIWVDNGCRARFAVDTPGWRRPSSNHSYDWDPYNRYNRHDNYDRNDRDSFYNQYDRSRRSINELEYERDRLRREREKIEEDKRRLEQQRIDRENLERTNNTCPPGSRPGRCSDSDRRRGCKDWRIPSGLGCRT